MIRKKFTMVIKREAPIVCTTTSSKVPLLEESLQKFTINSRKLTNEVQKQHLIDEKKIEEKNFENSSFENHEKQNQVVNCEEIITDKLTESLQKFTINSRKLTNEVQKQHLIDEKKIEEKNFENSSFENHEKQKQFAFVPFGHNCIYELLVEEKICSFCNKEFIKGIPVVPYEHIYNEAHCNSRIAEFNTRTMTDQKSEAWLKARHECITASVVAKITNKLDSKTIKSMIIEKAHYGKYSKNIKNIYTTYGELYEPLANMIYCYRSGRRTHEFGLIKHSVYDFIGASTDGVTSDLINIEIKCPTSRVVDGHISQLYYEQMQLQMEVLDINITHFFECNFITHTIEEFINNTFKHERGIIVEYLDENVEAYEYSPLEMHKDTTSLIDWKDSVHLRLMNNQKIITDTIYWSLLRVNCNEVLRDKEWFKQKLPLLEKFWKKVLEERETKSLEKIYYGNQLEDGVCMI